MKVSSSEFQKQPGRYQDTALQEPITITKHGRDHLVLLSAEVYQKLRKYSRHVLASDELSEKDLLEIESAKVPNEHECLNKEIE